MKKENKKDIRSLWGTLTEPIQHKILPYIKEKVVYDFGAGNLTFPRAFLRMGAQRVVAIDKVPLVEHKHPVDAGITVYEEYFLEFLNRRRDLPEKDAVAFLSWPANYKLEGLLDLMANFDTIIYIGKTTGACMCAWPGFFEAMLLRPIQTYLPDIQNNFIVWGKHDDTLAANPREPVQEEWSGLRYWRREEKTDSGLLVQADA